MLTEERVAEIRTAALKLAELRQATSGGQWRADGDTVIQPENGVDDIARFGDTMLGITPGDKNPRNNRDYVLALRAAGAEGMLLDLLEERVGLLKRVRELEARPEGEKAAVDSENATRSAKKR